MILPRIETSREAGRHVACGIAHLFTYIRPGGYSHGAPCALSALFFSSFPSLPSLSFLPFPFLFSCFSAQRAAGFCLGSGTTLRFEIPRNTSCVFVLTSPSSQIYWTGTTSLLLGTFRIYRIIQQASHLCSVMTNTLASDLSPRVGRLSSVVLMRSYTTAIRARNVRLWVWTNSTLTRDSP